MKVHPDPKSGPPHGRQPHRADSEPLALATVAPTLAAKPDRVFAESPTDFTISDICSFPVRAEVVVNQEYATTFYDRDGNVTRTHISGRYVVRLTNTTTGTAIKLQASGPGSFVADAEGLTVNARGTWLLFFAGRLLAVTGHTTLRVDAAGETIVGVRGRTVDLCEVLAG